MIELVSSTRCTRCDMCIKVCPTNVFDRGDDGIPVIARQDSCQTCFVCEAYCPADALFVAPLATPVSPDSPWLDESLLAELGELGRYRASIGWGPGRHPPRSADEVLALAAGNHPLPIRPLPGLSPDPRPNGPERVAN